MDEYNSSFPELQQENHSRRYSGKLLLRTEIPLDEHTFQRFLIMKLFTPIKSIKTKGFSQQCRRCGNQKRSLFASIPNKTSKKPSLYCRKCIEMGRVIEYELLYQWTGKAPDWPQHQEPCTWEGQLTAVQQQAADQVVEVVKSKQKELLIWAVCGAGKTEMLFPCITEALATGKRVCVATPRADVVRELVPRLQKAFKHIPVQGLYGGSEDKDGTAQIIVATTHQLLRYQTAFDLLIIDEIDAFPFHADKSLPFAANRAKASESTTIYLTATPRQKQRLQITRKKLPHVFVPVRFHGQPLPVPTMKMSFTLASSLNKYEPPASLIKWLKNRINPNRQLLIFLPTILLTNKMLSKLAVMLQKEGIIKASKELIAVHAQDFR